MDSLTKGTEHGAAVRWAAGFAASLVVALGKDIALNVQRVTDYGVGFAQGLVRPNA
jgi:hypothetical protein